jgi:hypothetical protein
MGAAVISDALLSTVLADQAQRQLIPCAELAGKPVKKCNCVKDTRPQFNQAELESVKICITRLDPAKLQQLKQLWKVDRIIVHLKTPGLPSRVML